MPWIDDKALTPPQAVARLCRWLQEVRSSGPERTLRLAVWVGDWAALDAAERALKEKEGEASVQVLPVNRALLEALPEAQILAEEERNPCGQEQVRTVLQEAWERLLLEGPLAGEVLVLKQFELVVAYRLGWGGVVQRTVLQPVLLLLPGAHEEGRWMAFPRAGHAGHPWPPELAPEASTWMVSHVPQ